MTVDQDIRDIAESLAFLVLHLPDDGTRMEKATNLLAEAMQGLSDRAKEPHP